MYGTGYHYQRLYHKTCSLDETFLSTNLFMSTAKLFVTLHTIRICATTTLVAVVTGNSNSLRRSFIGLVFSMGCERRRIRLWIIAESSHFFYLLYLTELHNKFKHKSAEISHWYLAFCYTCRVVVRCSCYTQRLGQQHSGMSNFVNVLGRHATRKSHFMIILVTVLICLHFYNEHS